jgi:hypothetical protein
MESVSIMQIPAEQIRMQEKEVEEARVAEAQAQVSLGHSSIIFFQIATESQRATKAMKSIVVPEKFSLFLHLMWGLNPMVCHCRRARLSSVGWRPDLLFCP